MKHFLCIDLTCTLTSSRPMVQLIAHGSESTGFGSAAGINGGV